MTAGARGAGVRVAGSGSFLPGEPVPFDDIERVLGPVPGAPAPVRRWLERVRPVMKEMVDIGFCHFAIDPVTRELAEDNVTMAAKAARAALARAGREPGEVDLIVYGSAHMDQMPTPSVRIQEALGIEACAELSVHANCTSAYKALLVARELIGSGRHRRALVLSSSVSSSELRAEYYNQALVRKDELFLRWFLSDGAGALLLEACGEGEGGVMVESAYMESVGGRKPSCMFDRRPAYWMSPREEFDQGRHHMVQLFQKELRSHFHEEGGTVFFKGLARMLARDAIDLEGLRFFQVNMPSRHIRELIADECEALGIPRAALYTKMSAMGYPGPPMAFICLDAILREETLRPGDLVLSFVTEVSKFMQAGFALRAR